MTLFIITGVSKGLGNDLLKEILQNKNSNVFVAGISRTEPVDIIQDDSYKWVRADLAQPETIVETIKQSIAGIHPAKICFISNAADINPLGVTGSLNEREIADALKINIQSPVYITNWLIHSFKETASIKILNISSSAAIQPITGWSQYCSAKAYMKMFFEVVQAEARDYKYPVQTVHINPGAMNTQMQQEIRESGIRSDQNERLIDLYKKGELKDSRAAAKEIFTGYIQNDL